MYTGKQTNKKFSWCTLLWWPGTEPTVSSRSTCTFLCLGSGSPLVGKTCLTHALPESLDRVIAGKLLSRNLSSAARPSVCCRSPAAEGAALKGAVVKNPLPMQETWVWSLGWEDLLEKEMATHSSTLAWRSPWTAESGGLKSMGSQSDTTNHAE